MNKIEKFIAEASTTNQTFLIAEIGVNHNGNISLAKDLILAAHQCGADAVKIQSFQADRFCDVFLEETKDVESIAQGTKNSYKMYQNLQLNIEQHLELKLFSEKHNILLFSSVFDEITVDELEAINWPAYKIASSDISYKSLIQKVISTGKPVMISTGMSDMEDVEACYNWCENKANLVLMQCSSLYPTELSEINLNVLKTFQKKFDCLVGFSDHSTSIDADLCAVACGARFIEKHFTLDHSLPGPDQKLSADILEFSEMVQKIRSLEKMLGDSDKVVLLREKDALNNSRRSIRSNMDLPKGTVLEKKHLICLKPYKGLEPKYMNQIIGKIISKNLKKHQPIQWDDFS